MNEKQVAKESVRPYRQGDEAMLCHIFNRFYRPYNGFFPKTPEMWEKAFCGHPDIGVKRINIYEDGQKPVGYLAYGKDGTIYDLCTTSTENQCCIYETLLKTSIRQASEEGIFSYSIMMPGYHKTIQKLAARLGFIESKMKVVHAAKITDMSMFIKNLIENTNQSITTSVRFRIYLDFTPKNKGSENRFNVDYYHGDAAGKNPLEIRCGWLSFGDLMFNTASFWYLWLTGKLKILPVHQVLKGYGILTAMKIAGRWHLPLIDHR
jgi:hypothetical protein